MLLLLLGFLDRSCVYAIPGTNKNVLISGKSLDTTRQSRLAQTNVDASTAPFAGAHVPINENEGAPSEQIQSFPQCFVCDSDSIPFVVDTGANRFIVNDARMLPDFKAVKGANVKGVGGAPVTIHGVGHYELKIGSE